MDSKTPFIWILIGFLLDIVGSLWALFNYFTLAGRFQSTGENMFSKTFGIDATTLVSMALQRALISAIAGLVLSAILVFFVIKISKSPTKGSYISVIVLGVIVLVTGHFGGILELIGGIMGLNKLKKDAQLEKSKV